jgi:hypothetical protein
MIRQWHVHEVAKRKLFGTKRGERLSLPRGEALVIIGQSLLTSISVIIRMVALQLALRIVPLFERMADGRYPVETVSFSPRAPLRSTHPYSLSCSTPALVIWTTSYLLIYADFSQKGHVGAKNLKTAHLH